MTIEEMSQYFEADIDRLKFYASHHLLECRHALDGTVHYQNIDMERISLLETLRKAGMSLTNLQCFLELSLDDPNARALQIKLLKKQRLCVLEDIHHKQQLLDRLDYIIREIRNDE